MEFRVIFWLYTLSLHPGNVVLALNGLMGFWAINAFTNSAVCEVLLGHFSGYVMFMAFISSLLYYYTDKARLRYIMACLFVFLNQSFYGTL